jgi:hypothetical protein
MRRQQYTGAKRGVMLLNRSQSAYSSHIGDGVDSDNEIERPLVNELRKRCIAKEESNSAR